MFVKKKFICACVWMDFFRSVLLLNYIHVEMRFKINRYICVKVFYTVSDTGMTSLL